MDLVSIIIPTYNRAKLIGRSVQSVLEQSYTNIELIIVDDNSSDETKEIVEAFNDYRIKYIKLEENCGACNARNIGIENSKGKFIAFQDSDDAWHCNKLEVQIKKMINTNADVSFCDFNRVFENKKSYQTYTDDNDQYVPYDELLFSNIASTQCIIAKKECFFDVKFDVSLPRLQDWDIILRLAEKFTILHIKSVLVDTFIQSDSISSDPKKGVVAMNMMIEKNKCQIKINQKARKFWLTLLADYKARCGMNPQFDYYSALKIKFDLKTYAKYTFAKYNLLLPFLDLSKRR